MYNIRIAILDSHDQVLAFMDNSAPGALHFYSDTLHEYLKGSANTFSFTARADHEDAQYLVEGNKVSFRDQDRQKDYYFNIMTVSKNELEIEVDCFGLVFELLNEDVGPYAAADAMSFAEYWAAFDPEGSTEIGLNEVSDKSIKNEWTGTETLLGRLYSLATVFSAEIEFVAELNDDYSLNRIAANIYREHSDTSQGVGDVRTDIVLRYGKGISGITKTSDITELYTAIRPTGKDGLKITNLDKTEYDEDGSIEFQSPVGDDSIRAVQARDRFPSSLTREYDGYIMKLWDYDTDDPEVLYGQALAQLKKISEPQIEYKIDGNINAGIGDTVRISDEEYTPPLYLTARITEQERSLTDPSKKSTTFDNFRELQNGIDPSLLKRVQELIRENDSYTATVDSSNGLIFKNGSGTAVLTAAVKRGTSDVTDQVEITWEKDGKTVGTGNTITVSAADIDSTAVYTAQVKNKNGALVATAQVSVANVDDGAAGPAGADGKMLYATSMTAGDVAAKVATTSDGDFSLDVGSTVSVRFTYQNSADNPTLNVDGTGPVPIMVNGLNYAYWQAGAAVSFVYDGTYWQAASQAIYGSTSLIGDPSGFNIYQDGRHIYFRHGEAIILVISTEVMIFWNGGITLSPHGLQFGFDTEALNSRATTYGPDEITHYKAGTLYHPASFDGDITKLKNAQTDSGAPYISTEDNPFLFRQASGNLVTENLERGAYEYPGYYDSAPSDWGGCVYVYKSSQGGDAKTVKYAFAMDGNVYYCRLNSSNAIEVNWTRVAGPSA